VKIKIITNAFFLSYSGTHYDCIVYQHKIDPSTSLRDNVVTIQEVFHVDDIKAALLAREVAEEQHRKQSKSSTSHKKLNWSGPGTTIFKEPKTMEDSTTTRNIIPIHDLGLIGKSIFHQVMNSPSSSPHFSPKFSPPSSNHSSNTYTRSGRTGISSPYSISSSSPIRSGNIYSSPKLPPRPLASSSSSSQTTYANTSRR
jgi:hypothetical protein